MNNFKNGIIDIGSHEIRLGMTETEVSGILKSDYQFIIRDLGKCSYFSIPKINFLGLSCVCRFQFSRKSLVMICITPSLDEYISHLSVYSREGVYQCVKQRYTDLIYLLENHTHPDHVDNITERQRSFHYDNFQLTVAIGRDYEDVSIMLEEYYG